MTDNLYRTQLQADDIANEKLVVKSILSTPHGRRWVWRFLEAANMFNADASRLDPQFLAFKEGSKLMGLFLLKPIQTHFPHEYTLMVGENVRINQLVAQADAAAHDQPEEPYQ